MVDISTPLSFPGSFPGDGCGNISLHDLFTPEAVAEERRAVRHRIRTVVVTGGSAGVGRATARAFARDGAEVAVIARGEQRLAATKAELEAFGVKCVAISADVADAAAVEAAAEQVENELGPIDVWVNNAMATVFARPRRGRGSPGRFRVRGPGLHRVAALPGRRIPGAHHDGADARAEHAQFGWSRNTMGKRRSPFRDFPARGGRERDRVGIAAPPSGADRV